MKKFIALVLAIAMLLSIASVASASSVNFNISTSITSVFQVGTIQFARDNTYWWLDVDMRTSNVSDTHRAVTRVHCGVNAASAKWVYSGPNGTSHNYITGYDSGLTFRGRLDDRDSGQLEFHGKFYK